MKISPQSIYRLYRHAIRHPQYRWLIILGTIAYFFNPFDLSPDMLPILGQFDDVVILGLFFSEMMKMAVEAFQAPQPPLETVNGEEKGMKTVDVDAVSLD